VSVQGIKMELHLRNESNGQPFTQFVPVKCGSLWDSKLKFQPTCWRRTVSVDGLICTMKLQELIFYNLLMETLSLTLREEHRLRVFENRVLRKIFGPKRDEVTGGWTTLHN
jgi:hypothetical protein